MCRIVVVLVTLLCLACTLVGATETGVVPSKAVEIKSYPNNFRVWKSLIAAHINGQVVNEASDFTFKKDNKKPSFLAVNPFGKVPTAFTSGGKEGVFESNSILRYVARLGEDHVPLYGSGPLEASRIDAFLDAELELQAALRPWIYPKLGFMDEDPVQTEKAKDTVYNLLRGINRQLKDSSYLVGDKLTIADIAWGCGLTRGYKMLFDAEFLEGLDRVTAYYKALHASPAFKAVIKEDIPLLAEQDGKSEL